MPARLNDCLTARLCDHDLALKLVRLPVKVQFQNGFIIGLLSALRFPQKGEIPSKSDVWKEGEEAEGRQEEADRENVQEMQEGQQEEAEGKEAEAGPAE